MEKEMAHLVTVGRVVKEWGREGAVLVAPLTFRPDRFKDLHEVAVVRAVRRGEDERSEAPQWKEVRSVSVHQGSVVVAFADCHTPEEARGYRGALLQTRASESPPLPDGLYYHYQIIGLTVVSVEGQVLGTVEEIIETGSNDVYVVRGKGAEHLIPALKSVVREINLDTATMTVVPMETVE